MTRCVDFETGASDFGVRILTVGKGVGFSGSSTDRALILHLELPMAPI